MKTGAIIGISIGVGIPGVLILIGLIAYLIKFIMKRFQKKAWQNIKTAPKSHDASDKGAHHRKQQKYPSAEHEPLYPQSENNNLDRTNSHVIIPVNETNLPVDEPSEESKHDHTIVQIQRDRLNRLKEQEFRERPMIRLSNGDDELQHVIDQAQKEFDES